jgi:hypothetical protein
MRPKAGRYKHETMGHTYDKISIVTIRKKWSGKPPAAGLYYETGGMKVPRLQILTAAQILDNRQPQVPFGFTKGFKRARREETGQE